MIDTEGEKPKPYLEHAGWRPTGALIRVFRNLGGHNLTEASSMLGVDEPTLMGIEDGKGPIPQTPEFYNDLRQFRGVTDVSIELLLRTSGAPAEVYLSVLPNYEPLTFADGTVTAIRQEPNSTEEEKEEIRELVRWAHEDFKVRRQARLEKDLSE